jgi:hypothetical protein
LQLFGTYLNRSNKLEKEETEQRIGSDQVGIRWGIVTKKGLFPNSENQKVLAPNNNPPPQPNQRSYIDPR